MNVTVKKWVQRRGDIGSCRVTVTVYGPTVTFAVTMPGPLTRKQAISRVYDQCVREGRWSPDFLRDLRAVADSRKAKGGAA